MLRPLQYGIPGGPELVVVNLVIVLALIYIAYRVLKAVMDGGF